MSRRRLELAGRLARNLTSPPLLVAITAMVFVWATLRDVADVRRRADSVRADVERARYELVAETALWRHAELASGSVCDRIAGVDVETAHAGDGYRVVCQPCDGDAVTFLAESLPGGAPAALGHPRVATAGDVLAAIGGGRRVTARELPRIDERQVTAAPRADESYGFVRDPGIALERLPAGTDREDFVWRSGGVLDVPGGLLVVEGNLWLPRRDGAFEVRVSRDLVLVVAGNIYLQRDVRAIGGGRLLFVAAPVAGAVTYADLDGSGTWSAGEPLRGAPQFRGPVEGCGMVFLDAGAPSAVLQLDAGLVVTGELHLRTDAMVEGPLVLHHGVTRVGEPGARVAGARWCYRPGRERVPGLVTTGPPRPGLPRRL